MSFWVAFIIFLGSILAGCFVLAGHIVRAQTEQKTLDETARHNREIERLTAQSLNLSPKPQPPESKIIPESEDCSRPDWLNLKP